MTAPNQFEDNAREQKCRKVVRYILAETVKVLESADDDMWTATAAKAEVNVPSEQSRKRIIEIIRRLMG